MSNDNDAGVDGTMMRTERFALERGYFEKPASELLRIAQELWQQTIKSGRDQSTTEVAAEPDENLLKYTAITAALSHKDYIAHVEAMAKLDRMDRD